MKVNAVKTAVEMQTYLLTYLVNIRVLSTDRSKQISTEPTNRCISDVTRMAAVVTTMATGEATVTKLQIKQFRQSFTKIFGFHFTCDHLRNRTK